MNGHLEIVKLIVQNNASLDHANDSELTALYLAIDNDHLDIAAYLMEKGADVNYNNDGWTSLALAASKGYLGIVKRLVQCSADVNFLDNRGFSPVMIAQSNNHLLVSIYLLDHIIETNNQFIKMLDDNENEKRSYKGQSYDSMSDFEHNL